jgi:ABC-type transport system involved in multi-copper enzyme maturation permease subunit
MMRELLRKDWRVYRTAVVGGAVLAACPYAVLLSNQALYPPAGGNTPETYGEAVVKAAIGGLVLTLLMAAVFGGIAFAAERRERSAEFVAMLPVRRGPVMLSKLLVAAAYLVLMAAVHACLGLAAVRLPGGSDFGPHVRSFAAASAVTVASTAVLCFGVAWMLSVYVQSPAIAATVAIGVAFVLSAVIGEWVEPQTGLGPNAVFGARWVASTVVSLAVGGLALLISSA